MTIYTATYHHNVSGKITQSQQQHTNEPITWFSKDLKTPSETRGSFRLPPSVIEDIWPVDGAPPVNGLRFSVCMFLFIWANTIWTFLSFCYSTTLLPALHLSFVRHQNQMIADKLWPHYSIQNLLWSHLTSLALCYQSLFQYLTVSLSFSLNWPAGCVKALLLLAQAPSQHSAAVAVCLHYGGLVQVMLMS